MSPLKLSVIKTLFALSCNRCAFPGCDERLADPQWGGVRADIAHIRGERRGAARYAPDMNEEERNSIENLVLLCPNHHREVDRLQPQNWPAERLMEVKAKHEDECTRRDWATDAQLEFFSSLILSSEDREESSRPVERPRLVIEKGEGDTFYVVNVGDDDAFDVTIELAPGSNSDSLIRTEDEPMRRLSPGARWRAGLYARTMGSGGTPVAVVKWTDSSRNPYEGEFPL